MPSNTSGTLNGDGRCYLNGTLTGGGTLNSYAPYVRMELDGNWSAFTGQINASGSDFRFNNPNGLPNAALFLNGNSAYYLNSPYAFTVGEISGTAAAVLSGTVWTVGGRNTTAVFAGVITGTSITKAGTGTWILTGNNTYTGATTISAGAIQIGQGSTNGTLGPNNANNVTDNAALIFNRYDSITYGGIVSGDGSLTQGGAGRLTLSAANTYTGSTYVSAGTLALATGGSITSSTNIDLANGAVLDVSEHSGGSLTLLSGQTLSGDGSVNGNFSMGSGSTLAPGNGGLGYLIFSNSLTMNPGSKTILKLSDNLQTNDIINASATLTGGGTLVLTNADTNPLQAGDAFKLFNAGIYAGNFSAIALPAVPSGLYCQTNTLRIDGTVRIAIEPSPAIITATLSGSKLMLAGTGGITNGTYYVLTSTNIAAPLSRWTRLLTNQFDANANFNFTNTLSPNAPQSFYLLQEP